MPVHVQMMARISLRSTISTISGGNAKRARLRQILVVSQLALSLVLVGNGRMVQSLQKLTAGPSFDARPIVLLRPRRSLIDYSDERAQAYQREPPLGSTCFQAC
jgi:hypothetical protein